jgi:NADPH:quinone reductase-like Zn-dependent oxidoreductase
VASIRHLGWIDDGSHTTLEPTILPLAEAAQAHVLLGQRSRHGKIVLAP